MTSGDPKESAFRACYYQQLADTISNNSNFPQKHPGVPDGSDGSDRTSYTLTENYTLPVAQATGRVAYVLLCFVVTFTNHQKDTCVTFFAGAAVMLKPFTQLLVMLNHSYYLSSTIFKTYAYSLYSHLCIYGSIKLICIPRHSVHLRYPCISVHPPSLINDVLGGRDRAS